MQQKLRMFTQWLTGLLFYKQQTEGVVEEGGGIHWPGFTAAEGVLEERGGGGNSVI